MQYTISLMGGKEYVINKDEYEAILSAKGFIALSRIGVTINPSSISSIEPFGMNSSVKVDRNKQTVGISPSGEVIEKRFGVWYYQKSNNPYQYNEDGQCMLRYTERTLLPTPDEYERIFQNIDESEWNKMLTDSSEYQALAIENRTSTNGLTKIDYAKNIEHKKEDDSQSEPEWCDAHQCFAIDCEEHHVSSEE